MKTNRLYLDDSYLIECDTVVLACEQAGDLWRVALKESVLFPEGGGQPPDKGLIDGIEVVDVQEEAETVWHTVKAPLEVGKAVHVQIDWDRRFDHMQQHTGEHLLSFCAHKMFEAKNVGFHMSGAYCTIDLDLPLSAEQIVQMEEETNRLVMKNLPVTLQYVTQEVLDELTLRKKAKEIEGVIRIVWIKDADSCTCCGTHCVATGEVGPVIVTAVEKHKEGVRITFLCGMRAYQHMRKVQDALDKIARRFSTSAFEAVDAVAKLQDEYNLVKHEIKRQDAKLAAYIGAELLSGAKTMKRGSAVVRLVNDLSPKQLKPLSQTLCANKGMHAVLFAKDGEYVQYVVACAKDAALDAGEICQVVNATLDGKGGGRGGLAQGRAPMKKGISEAVDQIEAYLCARLKG